MPPINYWQTPMQVFSSIVFSISVSGNYILSIAQSPIMNCSFFFPLPSPIDPFWHMYRLQPLFNHLYYSYSGPSHQLFSRLLQRLPKWSPCLFLCFLLSSLHTLTIVNLLKYAKSCYYKGILHKSEWNSKSFQYGLQNTPESGSIWFIWLQLLVYSLVPTLL